MSNEMQNAVKQAISGMVASGVCTKCSSFKRCVSRLSPSPAPSLWGGRGGERRESPFDWRFFVFLLLLMVSGFFVIAFGDVYCSVTEADDKVHITCEGFGQGGSGGGGDSGGGDTNCWGSCTNCIQMSPSEMVEFKSAAGTLIRDSYRSMNDVIAEADEAQERIKPLIDAPKGLQYYTGSITGSQSSQRTNFIHSVIDNVPSTNLVKRAYNASLNQTTGSAFVSNDAYLKVGAWNGALSYAEQTSDQLAMADVNLSAIKTHADIALGTLALAESMISQLPETPCSGGSDSGGSGGDSGGGSCENPDYVQWCTEEQGDAIIELLESLDDWAERKIQYLAHLTNYAASVEHNLKNGLFSGYTALPKTLYSGQDVGQETNKNWKTFYLEAGEGGKQFGYDPTNILQRIELLLYGMSGVADDDKEAPTRLNQSSYSNDVSTISDSFASIQDTTFLDDSSSSMNDVLSAFSTFINSFSGLRGSDLSAGQEYIPSYSVRVNGEDVEVPAINIGDESSASVWNNFKDLSRNFCTILYLLGGVFLFWHYWVWFAGWAVKFCKWSSELISSLFSS